MKMKRVKYCYGYQYKSTYYWNTFEIKDADGKKYTAYECNVGFIINNCFTGIKSLDVLRNVMKTYTTLQFSNAVWKCTQKVNMKMIEDFFENKNVKVKEKYIDNWEGLEITKRDPYICQQWAMDFCESYDCMFSDIKKQLIAENKEVTNV